MRLDGLLPVVVSAPLVAALVITLAGRGRWQRLVGPVAIVTSAGLAAALAVLSVAALDATRVHWFAGWLPRDGLVPGIPFVAGAVSAPVAAGTAALVAICLLFSSRYFAEATPHYQALMLTFLAGMLGFVLTGDLFNLFVFYELIGVSAYALTGHMIAHEGPLQGGINFAVSNTIGSLLLLAGGVFVYVETGTPNLAAAGAAISSTRPDAGVVAAFVLVSVGLFCKAAVVPFHFWHADAHAAAPTPVCAIFAAAMIEIGLLVFAKVTWIVFPGLWQPHVDAIRSLVVGLGVATALVAAIMCVLQRHLKRLLAFSSVAHVGVALVGVGLLNATGLAGAGVYLAGHAAVKAALFFGAGILLHRLGDIDEPDLHGRGRPLRQTGVLFALGGLALAGLPPFGLALGKELVEKAATQVGQGPLVLAVTLAVGALTGGAVLRVTAGVFLGWGRRPQPDPTAARVSGTSDEREMEGGDGRDDEGESDPRAPRRPGIMLGLMAILLLAGLLVGSVPALAHHVEAAAHWLANPDNYRQAVLQGRAVPPGTVPPAWFTTKGVVTGVVTAMLAVAVALAGLFADRWPARVQRAARVAGGLVARPLRAVHSGHVGDYVAWIVAGLAAMGLVAAATLT